MISKTRQMHATLLVAGTCIGAGMLGIPLVTFEAGFIPGLLFSAFVWFYMYLTGLMLSSVVLRRPKGTHLISLSEEFFGPIGKGVITLLFLFLYETLLTAYFAALPKLFPNINEGLLSPCFFAFFTIMIFLGTKKIEKVNSLFVLLLVLFYALLLASGFSTLEPSYIFRIIPSQFLIAGPVLFSAFGYQNIIPPLADSLERDEKALKRALFWGTFLAFAVFALWQLVIIGSFEVSALKKTAQEGQPIASVLANNWMLKIAMPAFAFFAIATSLIGVGLSTVHFVFDGLRLPGEKPSLRRFLVTLFVLAIPFLISLWHPEIFINALSFAGGFGETILNGALPIALFIGEERRLKHKFSLPQKANFSWMLLFTLLIIAQEAFSLLGL